MHRHRLRRHANIAAPDASIAQQPTRHKLRGIDADGKADSLRRQNRRRVHPDYAPRRIDQWPARVARIQRRIRLNHIINQPPGVRPQRTPQRADHARRHRRLKSVRRADRNYDLPDTFSRCESPSVAAPSPGSSKCGSSIRITARSLPGSSPISEAGMRRPSASVTAIRTAS